MGAMIQFQSLRVAHRSVEDSEATDGVNCGVCSKGSNLNTLEKGASASGVRGGELMG